MAIGTKGMAMGAEPASVPSDLHEWLAWLAEQGEMGGRVAGFDWSTTTLGPIENWPTHLRGAVSLCLGSLFPMSVRWSAELIVLYNDACRDIYGPDRFATALGRSTAEVWPETGEQVSERLTAIMDEGQPFFANDLMVPINRLVPMEECYFTFSYTPIVGDAGRPSGVFSTFIETTTEVLAVRRMHTLATLGRELSASRTAAEAAPAAMAVFAENPMDHPSGALYAVTGGGPDLTPLATFGDYDLERTVELVRACIRDGVSRHTPADHAVAQWHAYPVSDPEEEVAAHVLVFAQHEQRPWDDALAGYFELVAGTLGAALLSQQELLVERRRTTRLTAIDAARSAFFAGVSHELRTPLALISAPVQDVLEREDGLSESSVDALALVQDNVARLTRMVEAMLDFARLEAGRLVPNLEAVDVSVLTAGLAASFAPAFERAGIEFTSDVPAVERPALLDRDFFERIISNLLTNALKFTPSGRVELHLESDEVGYWITVRDTGLGIHPADQDRVFARFERLPPKPGARSTSGAGIGLAMVRQLTELLNGSVTLDSEPGKGSTFTVALPFAPSRPVGVAGASITPRHVDSFLAEIDTWADPRGSRRWFGPAHAARLLVVEDDPEMARFLANCLSADYTVEVAGDGRQALDLLRQHGADLVLSDFTMPKLDGLGLIAEIRSDPDLRDLPVVLLSSRGGDESAAAGLQRGADDYVTKPFSLLDLRGRLAANLARARERSADAAWRRAIMAALHDPLVIFDSEGLVIELNQAFTSMFGYTLADGPLRPPYPWWPTEAEDADALAAIRELYLDASASRTVEAEVVFYTRERRPIWVHSTGSSVEQPATGLNARIRVLRDITKQKQAQQRRAAAAQVSGDFGRTDDLATLLGVAEHGFELLFDGGSTIQLDIGDRYLFSSGRHLDAHELAAEIAAGLGGSPSADTTSLRPGILLVPQTSTTGARAWVQFPRPRQIGTDEMIAADLLAQAFGLAVDRLVAAQQAAGRQANLQQAMDSHRLIGQAVGILVERHRLRPGEAFDRLKQASQNRNLKLRDIAQRVIETGAEPDLA
ncbi:MAG TPA: ATP-binding protein [Propionicimonas sp.]|nr:ATP-binding protein [Propionicimonas sp.]